jgi:trimethylamine corrinoid protein
MDPIKEKILDRAKNAVIDLSESAVKEIALEAIEAGVDPVQLIERGFIEGMRSFGDLFEEGRCQLPQMFAASRIVESGISALTPLLTGSKNEMCCFGNIVVEV